MTENSIQTKISDERKFRLHFLDGMRGIAAFYVLLTHLWLYQGENLPPWITIPTKFVRYGCFCVVVFIVLSGYCLMLPVARSGAGYIPGTLLDYFKRRARKIIPAYYAVILFCCLLSLGVLALERFTTFQWQTIDKDMFYPHFSTVDVFIHSLLIQNFATNTQTYMLNIPLWSVSLEWQIYFLFPLFMKLSVIIPCYNAASTIAIQLEALANQKWSQPWEVIVADNGSTDNSVAIAELFKQKIPSLRIVDASAKKGAAYARNIGASIAYAEALAFCDADDEVAPFWVAAMGEALAKYDFVTGRSLYDKLNEPWVIANHGSSDGFCIIENPYLPFAISCNIGVKRAVHQAIGGFDETFAMIEDIDYSWCIQEQ